VDLFTRLIADKRVSSDYSQPIEVINDKFRIVRIQCGGRKYMRKELLWPHLEEYVDRRSSLSSETRPCRTSSTGIIPMPAMWPCSWQTFSGCLSSIPAIHSGGPNWPDFWSRG
jgi:hypothetical protein